MRNPNVAKPRSSSPVKKPHQHHVWQQYLCAWSVDGKVYCLQGDRIFPTGTPVLGVKTDFYKVHLFTEADLKLLHFLLALDKVHPIARKHHEMVLQNILTPMLFVQQNRGRLDNMGSLDGVVRNDEKPPASRALTCRAMEFSRCIYLAQRSG
jgi:hypothetical protein